jgi:hypothetical protein
MTRPKSAALPDPQNERRPPGVHELRVPRVHECPVRGGTVSRSAAPGEYRLGFWGPPWVANNSLAPPSPRLGSPIRGPWCFTHHLENRLKVRPSDLCRDNLKCAYSGQASDGPAGTVPAEPCGQERPLEQDSPAAPAPTTLQRL